MLEQLQKIERLGQAVDEAFYMWTAWSCERLRVIPIVGLLLKCTRCLYAFLSRGLFFKAMAAYWSWVTDYVNERVAEFEAVAQLGMKMPLGACRVRYSYHLSLQNQMMSLQWHLISCLEQELARAMALRKYRNHLLDVLEWSNQMADKWRVIIQEGELAKNLQALEDLKKIWRLLIEEEKRLNGELKKYPLQT